MSSVHLSANQWRFKGGREVKNKVRQVLPANKHSKHRAAVQICPQPVKIEKSHSGKADRQRTVISCVIKQMQTDRAAIGYFAPQLHISSGAAGAWRRSSRSYVKYVNNWQAELAESCWSLLLQPTTEDKNSLSDSERKSIRYCHLHPKDNINILSSFQTDICMQKACSMQKKILKNSHIN